MAETVATTVVEMAAEKGIQAMVHQIGYCIHYKKNVRSLDEKVKALQAVRTEIQERVTAAKKNLDSIKNDVEIWLENVRKEMEEDEIMAGLMNFINGEEARMFNHDICCKGWCCILARHKIGREAQKKIDDMEKLLNEGKSFNDVSYPSPNLVASVITQFVNTDGNIAFASREIIMNEIMSALKDEETYSVGIYGMGGVGKTMMKNRIHKQVAGEKLFNVVATSTVSQNISVKKIQDDIAQTLKFDKLDGIDDTTKRAALLLRRLEKEENILVVLDDIWTMDLNLCTDVGIPYCYKGCKVLITTRIPEVCNSLKIQKTVEIKGLSEDESLYLFKQNVGDVVDSPALQEVAREVVNECGCLPLALVTVGRALQNKDKPEWVYIANQLKSSNFTDIEGMTSQVYTPIKLSYDFLENDILKKCFLLCCLFSEDQSISVDDLLIYAIGDEVIRGDLETLVQVRARLHHAITKLVALGLLIRDEENVFQIFSAKMHDIVRDVAILIASGGGNRFYVKAGLYLRNWPEAGLSSMSNCSRISLMDNNITVLPDQPELPHLLSLSFRNNRSLRNIPDRFFGNMNALQSLDLHNTNISTFPSSISSLVSLRSLDMGIDGVGRPGQLGKLDISSLGELKKLEVLNLGGLSISVSLPKEIGGLSRLKWLDLSETPGFIVLPGIISKLTCLEYLNMENSFESWEVGESRGESGRFANLNEIATLPRLIYVDLEATWGHDQTIRMYGEYHGWTESLSCHLSGAFPFCNSISILMTIAENVTFSHCSNLKNLASLLTSTGFSNKKFLQFGWCNYMEYILDSTTVPKEEIPKALFTALEELHLKQLPELKEVFHGPMPAEFSLENIKHLTIQGCPELARVFSLEMFLKLKNLEELEVNRCHMLKRVFPGEKRSRLDSSNDQKQEHGNTFLPQLRKLLLTDLPMITSIWKQAIFSLGNLKSLDVNRCDKLRYLFTSAMVNDLQQLELLKIDECSSLVTIIVAKDELTVENNQIMNVHFQTITMFPNLRIFKIIDCNSLKVFSCRPAEMLELEEEEEAEEEEEELGYCYNSDSDSDSESESESSDHDDERSLTLASLPYLKDIWGGIVPIQSFLNVTDARIEHCGWLKHLIPIQVLLRGGLSKLKKLQVKHCQLLETIIDTDDGIVISDPPNHIILENLEILVVEKCNRLKHILPMKLLVQGGLPNLEVIDVSECKDLKMICYEDGGDNKTVLEPAMVVFLKLKNLYLYSLPQLSSFHQQRNRLIHFGWPSLVSMFIIECNLKKLPLSHKDVPPNLNKIIGDSEEMFEKWLELEDESMKSSLRPLFKVYHYSDWWSRYRSRN
ncbi:hypothetical protein MKX03_008088 [Papaver bracteatum]|nr:hypothetical protein MKX03_008088 [Papaver bracteatum]